MIDPVQAFLQNNALAPSPFSPTSRYYGIPTARLMQADGRTAVYVLRRFLPQPDNFAPAQIVAVSEGDRLDNMAAAYTGDPLQWWRICDANGAMQPELLVAEPGSTVIIAFSEGVSGTVDGQ